MTKARKKLPIGIQTFAEIREDGYCYVDKTPLIGRMVESGKYYFLSRPRRFGKSLLVSTLQAAFEGRKDFFRGLYLEQNWDWSKKYPVLVLSFADGVLKSRVELEKRIANILKVNQEYLGVECDLSLDNASLFIELLGKAEMKYGQRAVVLVDEYDKPILDNIQDLHIAAEIREGLKNLYSVIKGQDAHIKFAFLTGVSKFGKVSLFSGLNNLMDLTLDGRYATICGYTESDLSAVFGEYLDGVDLARLREWYDGYNFLGEKVYNPFDVLLFLERREYKNYWFETGSPEFLLKLVEQKRYLVPRLDGLTTGESLLSGFDLERIELESLLFQTGYLTVDSMEELGGETFYKLKYPNREVKTCLNRSLLAYLTQAPAEGAENRRLIYQALQHGEVAALQPVLHALFAAIPHDWHRKNRLAGYEGFYASIIYCCFAAQGLHVIAEDATNHGRIDLSVQLENKVYLLEFKVVESGVEGDDPLAQLKNKRYAEKYVGTGKTVYLVGIRFDPTARNLVGFDWEKQ